MRILFNAYNCGLANNGGSQTIIRTAEELCRAGHYAVIVTRVCGYTVNKHEAEIVDCIPDDIDAFDAVINVSAWEIEHTLSLKHRNAYWWLRSWEDYVAGVDIRYYIKQIPMLVNSVGLQDKLLSYGVDSKYVPQGIEFDFWKPSTGKPAKPRIGFLADKRAGKNTRDALKVADKMGTRFNYAAVGLSRTIDSETREEIKARGIPLLEDLNRYRMRDFYSLCNVWLQTSESEGLCNMAMEAALCNCLIIANSKMSGVADYHQYTLPYYDVDHACVWLKQYPDKYIERFVNNCRSGIVEKIGSRQQCVERLLAAVTKDGK